MEFNDPLGANGDCDSGEADTNDANNVHNTIKNDNSSDIINEVDIATNDNLESSGNTNKPNDVYNSNADLTMKIEDNSTDNESTSHIRDDSSEDISCDFKEMNMEKNEISKDNPRDHLDIQADDLHITVDNPEKHSSTLDCYITFRISVKSSREQFRNRDIAVQRRYSDFVWLRQRLNCTMGHYFIPPLPEKHRMKVMDRFDSDFIRTRACGLETFLNRVAAHGVLSTTPLFISFISADQTEFTAIRKEGGSVLDRLSATLSSQKSAFVLRGRRPQRFIDISRSVESLADRLRDIERVNRMVCREHEEVLNQLGQASPLFNAWSSIEPYLQSTLESVAKSTSQVYTSTEKLITETGENFGSDIHEYILYTDSIKESLMKRDVAQNDYENSNRELRETTNDLRSEKLKIKTEYNEDCMIKVDAIIASETDRWNKIRNKDLKKTFNNLTDSQIEYYKNCLSAWESTIFTIQKNAKK